MNIEIVSHHLPDGQGTAAGRALLGLVQGLHAAGHEVAVRSWAPEEPSADLPSWCTWHAPAPETRWRTRGRAVVRPRFDAKRLGLALDPAALVVADDPLSYGAVRRLPRRAVTFHFATRLDAAARGGRSLRDVQDCRAEAFAARDAPLATAYSDRVAASLGSGVTPVPVPYPTSSAPLPPVDQPVAAVIANWAWPPNAMALERLLRIWPTVHADVRGARLVVAGRGLDRHAFGVPGGVDVLGPVADSQHVLSFAAVVAFPCPSTSGPKVKVLEAMAAGRAVVTTTAGIEGIDVDASCAIVADDDHSFAAALTTALRDPVACADTGRRAAAAVRSSHSPDRAALARLAAWKVDPALHR